MGNIRFTSNIITIADYEQSLTLEPDGPTLVRIRGHLSTFYFDSAGPSIEEFAVWILAMDSEEDVTAVAYNPQSAVGAIKQDVLWWMTCQRFSNLPEPFDVDIDIKAKRKLRDTKVVLIAQGSSGLPSTGSWTLQYNARALLRGGF